MVTPWRFMRLSREGKNGSERMTFDASVSNRLQLVTQRRWPREWLKAQSRGSIEWIPLTNRRRLRVNVDFRAYAHRQNDINYCLAVVPLFFEAERSSDLLSGLNQSAGRVNQRPRHLWRGMDHPRPARTAAVSFQFQVRQLTYSFAKLFRDRTDVPFSIGTLGMSCGG